MKKTGVLLIQLGTPDSPSKKDVRSYLRQFLNDPRVIDIAWWKRLLLVNGVIIPFRTANSSKIYQKLWQLSNGISPLLQHTQVITEQLNLLFEQENTYFHFAMRYKNPSLEVVLGEMKKQNYERIILIPLFPHYASASTGSAVEKALQIMQAWWAIPEIKVIAQFYDNVGYINSLVAHAKQYPLAAYDHIIFSYHGIPERHVDKVHPSGKCSDFNCENEINTQNALCYKATCYATTRLLVAKLGLKEGDYTVSFQSRLNDRWVAPYTDKVVEEWGKKGAKKLLVFSPSFVADCLETTVEIGVEYQEIFQRLGGEKVQLVESCNQDKIFIDGLAVLVREP